MCEFTWWYLYIQVLNEENIKRKELYDIIELLLPWFNLELWQEVQKQKERGRENIDFENQLRSMLYGTWNPDPNSSQFGQVDDISSSVRGPIDLRGLFDQMSGSPGGIDNTIQPPWDQGDLTNFPEE